MHLHDISYRDEYTLETLIDETLMMIISGQLQVGDNHYSNNDVIPLHPLDQMSLSLPS